MKRSITVLSAFLLVCLAYIIGLITGISVGYRDGKDSCVKVTYQDEMPGIGGTPCKPDTALCYVIPGTYTIKVEYLPVHETK